MEIVGPSSQFHPPFSPALPPPTTRPRAALEIEAPLPGTKDPQPLPRLRHCELRGGDTRLGAGAGSPRPRQCPPPHRKRGRSAGPNPLSNVFSPGLSQCTNFFLAHDQSHPRLDESSCKDIVNALSLVNMVLGLFSIFCSFYRKSHCASWLLLISFLLDMAVGTMTRHLSSCSKSRAELNDFAVFTTFGLASALLLGMDGPLSGLLAIMYVLATSFRLCFFSAGVPFIYKGLPCSYASCVLASTSLLTKGNTFILCCVASLMILFMMDQTYYPHEEILESEKWKKIVYLGGVIMLFLSPFSLTPSLLPAVVRLLHLLSRFSVGKDNLSQATAPGN